MSHQLDFQVTIWSEYGEQFLELEQRLNALIQSLEDESNPCIRLNRLGHVLQMEALNLQYIQQVDIHSVDIHSVDINWDEEGEDATLEIE